MERVRNTSPGRKILHKVSGAYAMTQYGIPGGKTKVNGPNKLHVETDASVREREPDDGVAGHGNSNKNASTRSIFMQMKV